MKVHPPSQLLKFEGRRDWPLDESKDDWGLTPEQQVRAHVRGCARARQWGLQHWGVGRTG